MPWSEVASSFDKPSNEALGELAVAAQQMTDHYDRVTITGAPESAEQRSKRADGFWDSYQKTCQINDLAGNEWNKGWSALDHQIKIVSSEFQELVDGIAARDLHEVIDGLGDVLFTLYGLAHRAGLRLPPIIAEVVRSNLTKFDPTDADANLTLAKYAELGVEVYQKQQGLNDTTYWITYASEDQIGRDGKTYIKGKWLKSHRWEDVNFPMSVYDAENMLLDPAEDVRVSSSTEAQNAAESLVYSAGYNQLDTYLMTNGAFGLAMERLMADEAVKVFERIESTTEVAGTIYEKMPVHFPRSAAVKGAQYFLHVLTVKQGRDQSYSGKLLPTSTLESSGIGIQCLLDTLEENQQKFDFRRAIDGYGVALAGDDGMLIGWHSNLTGAFFQYDVPFVVAEEIADAIIKRIFEVSSVHHFHRHQKPRVAGNEDDAAQVA